MPTVRRCGSGRTEPLWGLPIPQIDHLLPRCGDMAASEQQAALKARYFNRLAGVVERWHYAVAVVESFTEFFDDWARTYLGRVADYEGSLCTYAALLIQRAKEESATFAQIHNRQSVWTLLTGAGQQLLHKEGMSSFTSSFVAEELQTRLRDRKRYWLAVAAAKPIPRGGKPSAQVIDTARDRPVEDRLTEAAPDPTRLAIQEALDAGNRKEAVRLWHQRTGNTKASLYQKAGVHRSDYYKWEHGRIKDESVKHTNLRRELLAV